MSVGRRRWLLLAFSLVCILSTAGLISVGYSLFQGRPRVFWIFFAYAAGLGGIVLYFGIKILNLKFPPTDRRT